MEPKKYSPVLKWSLIIGIVIVVNLFFNYLISLVYTAPEYNNFCKSTQVVAEVNTEKACLDQGGQWNSNIAEPQMVAPDKTLVRGSCDLQYTCRTDFDNTSKTYNRNVFIVLVILGVVLVALSFVLAFNAILSISFSLGGILSIIIASLRYWSDADNLVRVVILFLALAALIYFAVKKFKN